MADKDKNQNEKRASALKGVDSLFETPDAPKVDANAKDEELALVPVGSLYDFPDHPFTVADDDDMAELMADIQERGISTRLEVRRRPQGGFEIISGHRRRFAAQKLGLKEVPVIIRQMSDEDAIMQMVSSNMARKRINPMDEAKAFKMRMEAMKRQGKAAGDGKAVRTDQLIAERIKKSRMYVQRKVKLNELIPELQDLVREYQLSETPAYEAAFLPAETQLVLWDWMISEDRAPTKPQVQSVREHSGVLEKDGKQLDEEQIWQILDGQRLQDILPLEQEEKGEQAEKKDGPAPEQTGPAAAEQDAPSAGQDAPVATQDTPAPAAGEPPAAEQGSSQPPIEFPAPPAEMPPGDAQTKQGVSEPVGAGAAEGAKGPLQGENGASPETSALPSPAQNMPTEQEKQAQREAIITELRLTHVILPIAAVKAHFPNAKTSEQYEAGILKVMKDLSKKKQVVKEGASKSTPSKPGALTKGTASGKSKKAGDRGAK